MFAKLKKPSLLRSLCSSPSFCYCQSLFLFVLFSPVCHLSLFLLLGPQGQVFSPEIPKPAKNLLMLNAFENTVGYSNQRTSPLPPPTHLHSWTPFPSSSFLSYSSSFFFCLATPQACGIIFPDPGIELVTPTVEVWRFNHWIPREVPLLFFFLSISSHFPISSSPSHYKSFIQKRTVMSRVSPQSYKPRAIQ